MKIIDVPQGTAEWFIARMGIPTASEFDRILTPKTLKPSSQLPAYCNRLLAEWLTQTPWEQETNVWMERGKTLEQEAVDYYQMLTGTQTQEVGFCVTDDGKAGCSPDRLVGDDGLLEIKCPLPSTHVGYLLGGELPAEYLLQVQGQLLVTGRHWVDFLSYFPGLPHLLIRCTPIKEVQAALREALTACHVYLEAGKRKLTALQGGTYDRTRE